MRFLKKVRVWAFVLFCFVFFNSNTCDAVLTLMVFKPVRFDRWGTQQKHANIVALNKCWPSCDGVTSTAWFVKSQNKNQHHIIYYMIIPFIMICITWLLPHPAVRSCYFLLELFCVLKWVLQLLLCGWSGQTLDEIVILITLVLQKVRERKTKVSKGVFVQLWTCNYCVAVCNRLVTALGAFYSVWTHTSYEITDCFFLCLSLTLTGSLPHDCTLHHPQTRNVLDQI